MAKLVLWLAVIALVLLSFEVAARDLAETTHTTLTQHTSGESGKRFVDGYGGGGYRCGHRGCCGSRLFFGRCSRCCANAAQTAEAEASTGQQPHN